MDRIKQQFKDIADMIRLRNGTTEPIPVSDMPELIRTLAGGNYIAESIVSEDGKTQTLSFTTYKAPIVPVIPVTYGVRINLNDSNSVSCIEYTDDAVDFESSYMDFNTKNFVYGSWKDKFPFNQIKPCILKDGKVVTYLNPNDYTQDIKGNIIDITNNCDGDVMIEIPKIYYYLHKDTNYQYIQISNTKINNNYCCLAHTYKGVEKDKIYIGAYQSYYDGVMTRSVSGVNSTVYKTLDEWRTYSRNHGEGYENMHWHIAVLLQSLFLIQFKNLDSQGIMGYGLCNSTSCISVGNLNNKGLNYCDSNIESSQVKWLGIEDIWGNAATGLDGAMIVEHDYYGGKRFVKCLHVLDTSSTTADFNENADGYTNVAGYVYGQGYLKEVVGTNLGGFMYYSNQGSAYYGTADTYYQDYYYVYNADAYPFLGGRYDDGDKAGMFLLYYGYGKGHSSYNFCNTRLCYCG